MFANLDAPFGSAQALIRVIEFNFAEIVLYFPETFLTPQSRLVCLALPDTALLRNV
jgi:hypothetical protein